MKKKIRLVGIIALAVLIGFSVVSCGEKALTLQDIFTGRVLIASVSDFEEAEYQTMKLDDNGLPVGISDDDVPVNASLAYGVIPNTGTNINAYEKLAMISPMTISGGITSINKIIASTGNEVNRRAFYDAAMKLTTKNGEAAAIGGLEVPVADLRVLTNAAINAVEGTALGKAGYAGKFTLSSDYKVDNIVQIPAGDYVIIVFAEANSTEVVDYY